MIAGWRAGLVWCVANFLPKSDAAYANSKPPLHLRTPLTLSPMHPSKPGPPTTFRIPVSVAVARGAVHSLFPKEHLAQLEPLIPPFALLPPITLFLTHFVHLLRRAADSAYSTKRELSPPEDSE